MSDAPTTSRPRAPLGDLPQRLWPHDPQGRAFTIGMAVAMLVGLVVRVGFVLTRQGNAGLPGDAFWYHHQGRLVAEGRGFLDPFLYEVEGLVGPGADHPHGFVLVLAGLDLLGISSPQGQRLAMCLVGVATIWLVGLLGRRLLNPAVGVIAAAIAAIYPNVWINDFMLMPETLFVFAIAVSLVGCYRYLDRPNRLDLAIVAAGLTLAGTTRPESLALFAVFLLPMVLRRASLTWRERITHVVVAAVLPIVAFGPWVLYNISRFEEPVTVSTGSGQTLAAGNCDLTYDGPALGYYDIRCLDEPVRARPPGDPSVRDAAYRELALEYMSEHRSELPRVVAARIGRVWHLYQPSQSITLDGFVERRSGGPQSGERGLVRSALIGYYLLVPLAIAGGVILRRRLVPVWPLLVQPALVTFTAATTFGVTRYRAGAELTLVALAAVTLWWAYDQLGDRLRERRTTTPGADTEAPPRGGAATSEEPPTVTVSERP